MSKNKIELKDEDLQNVTGGDTVELTQEQLDSGNYQLNTAEYIKIGNKLYMCSNQFVAGANNQSMYVFMRYVEVGGTGTLLIPQKNYDGES